MKMKTKSVQSSPANLASAIGGAILEFQTQCASVAASQIDLTNRARQIGLLVQSWCGHEQMNFEFWQKHRAELPKEISFDTIKHFVAIARRLPEKVAKLEDARRVWQTTFQSAGLLELPERTEAQKPVAVSPFVALVREVGSVRQVLADWNRDEPFESWNRETRMAVAAQIKPLADFHVQLVTRD